MNDDSYDAKCADLAFHFLCDSGPVPPPTEDKVRELALIIQQAVEDYLDE